MLINDIFCQVMSIVFIFLRIPHILVSIADAEAEAEIIKVLKFDGSLKLWYCETCDYNHQARSVVYNHIDAKHFNFVYLCQYCGRASPTRHANREHVRTMHKGVQLTK